VDYSGSVFAEYIGVRLLKPVSRSALLQKFSLPQQADATTTNDEGQLSEIFGGQSLLALTYATGEASSGVTVIHYYSMEFFRRELHLAQGKPDVPALNANVTSLLFFGDDARETALKNVDKRVYRTRFSQSETAHVTFVISLEHPAPDRRIQIAFGTKWYDSKRMLAEGTVQLYVQAKEAASVFADTFDPTAGSLEVGIYRVEILFNGQLVATGSFEVY
jgi:hypothetical protein